MNFTKFVFENYQEFQDKIAIYQKQTTFTYAEIYSLMMAIVSDLRAKNILPQEKVVIVADNSPFFIASYFGIIAAGAVAIPLHHQFGETNFQFVVDSCKTRKYFIQSKYLKKIRGYNLKLGDIYTEKDIPGATNIFSLQKKDPEYQEINDKKDLAVIIFTSGSTGVPKGVMQSHRNLIANTQSIIEYLNLQETDRVMVVLPFSYCFGASLLHTHFRVKGSVVLNNYFMFPGKILKEINEKECTVLAGVPSTFQILLRRSALKDMTFPSLRLVQQAGGKLPNNFILELQKALPTTLIYIMYGQTEATARISYLPPILLQKKLGSIGRGIPGTKVEVLNKEGTPVKPGEIGEIVASGDNITQGYWEDPNETNKNFRDGKLFTGDLGTVDEEGYIFLTDREKNILKVGGFRVSPKEIEDYIIDLEEVVEVAIIGIPDELLGEAMKAYIALKNNSTLSEEDIIKYCRNKFPLHKVPKEIEFLKELPKNTSSKIDKVKLKLLDKKTRGEIK